MGYYTFVGEIEWDGEDREDVGRIRGEGSAVSVVKAQIVYPDD